MEENEQTTKTNYFVEMLTLLVMNVFFGGAATILWNASMPTLGLPSFTLVSGICGYFLIVLVIYFPVLYALISALQVHRAYIASDTPKKNNWGQ